MSSKELRKLIYYAKLGAYMSAMIQSHPYQEDFWLDAADFFVQDHLLISEEDKVLVASLVDYVRKEVHKWIWEQ